MIYESESFKVRELDKNDIEAVREITYDLPWTKVMPEMETLEVKNNRGHMLKGGIYRPSESERVPMVIFCHGFGGCYKEIEHHAKGMAQEGIACALFDFYGGGMQSQSGGSMLEMSLTSEMDDLECALDAIKGYEYVDPDRLFLMGESQGGFVSAMIGAKRQDDIAGMLLWYPAFMIHDDMEKACPDHQPKEISVFGLPVSAEYVKDGLEIDPYERMPDFKKQVLIIHGDRDDIVPISYSERAAQCYPHARLEVITGGGHGFDGRDSDHARELSIEFIDKVASAEADIG